MSNIQITPIPNASVEIKCQRIAYYMSGQYGQNTNTEHNEEAAEPSRC